jgi:hypothetical protein
VKTIAVNGIGCKNVAAVCEPIQFVLLSATIGSGLQYLLRAVRVLSTDTRAE